MKIGTSTKSSHFNRQFAYSTPLFFGYFWVGFLVSLLRGETMRLGFCDLENLLELPGPLPLPPAAEPAKDEDVLLELKIPSLKLTENRPLEFLRFLLETTIFMGYVSFRVGSYTDIYQYVPESSKGFRCQAYHHSTSATSLCRRPRHVCQCFLIVAPKKIYYLCIDCSDLLICLLQIILACCPHKTSKVKYISHVTLKINKNPKLAPWKWWKIQVPILIFLPAYVITHKDPWEVYIYLHEWLNYMVFM